MIVIKHKGGWSACNIGHIATKRVPHYIDGVMQPMQEHKELVMETTPFTVEGSLSGEVTFAIKDDQSGVVSCFIGTMASNSRIRITANTDNKWLNNIKYICNNN